MVAIFVGLISVLVLLILVSWISRRRRIEEWKRAGIPCPWAWPIFGNYTPFIFQKKLAAEVAQDICLKYPDAPMIATFYGTEPALLIQDLELVKTVLLKDFVFFNGREVSAHTDREIITRNLFFAHGDRWKIIRQNFTPLFTSSKIKSMFNHVRKCNYMFEDLLEHLTNSGKKSDIDVMELMVRYTMDNICSMGFGVDTETLAINYDPKNPFMKIGKEIYDNSNIRGLALFIRAVWPTIFYGLGFKLFPDIIRHFFDDMLSKVFEDRHYEPSPRNDFVDMVLGLKKLDTIESESMMKDGIVTIKLDDELLQSQCVVFFGAGFETSAATLGFTLYELAKCQEAQEKVLKEIDTWLKGNKYKLDYSCVTDLPYLYACVEETLRFYPVQPLLARETMVDHHLGGVKVPKGTRIHISVHHIHHDERYYPDPEVFIPERYLGANRQNIKPYTYMPFGEGNRICVGIRVARMMIMPGLVTVLKRYRVELAPGTPHKVTLDPRTITAQPREDLILKLTPRTSLDLVKYDKSSD